ncbi:MAG: aromatic ring-hydroxylating dioxygenase subunit alpha [Actinobacteria bacterium]|nr:aromatic ring-hydroxylating dioxygenase subunit alpha [Actinomycetota bacterium]
MNGHEGASVAFPARWWYPACTTRELGTRPLTTTLMETPLAIFRDRRGGLGALVDRCPHRNYPPSLGRVIPDGVLECGYHGWRFDACGNCVTVPGLLDGQEAAATTRRAVSHAAVERDGIVWVWGEPEVAPTREPFPLPLISGRGAGEVVFRYDLDCSLHAALENALDVPHTAFLHRGIFRGGNPRSITAVRKELSDGVEAQYLGEPVGMGPIRARAESQRTFDHWDRFFLPSIAQIEYAIEGWARVVNTVLHLPLSPYRTRAWFVVRYWSRLPASVVRPAVLLRGKQILRQDARALAAQTSRIRAFGGERYTSTDLDILGNAIWRLLRQAERSESGLTTAAELGGNGDRHPEPVERTVTFNV